jgi:hypothetical protein
METKQPNLGAADALGRLIEPLGLTLDDVGGSVNFLGSDPLFPSCVRLGEAFSIAAMTTAVGAAAIWRGRTGKGQNLSIDKHATSRFSVPCKHTSVTLRTTMLIPPLDPPQQAATRRRGDHGSTGAFAVDQRASGSRDVIAGAMVRRSS